jgi:hypothetical protein
MVAVQEDTVWCKKNTGYYASYCYCISMKRVCKEVK